MATLQERQVKPIYGVYKDCLAHVCRIYSGFIVDALETGSLKAALQACNKLLKKQPNSELVKVRLA